MASDQIITRAIQIAVGMLGIALNVFILQVTIQSLKRKQNLAELIYLFMGLANICLQMIVTADVVVDHFWPYLLEKKDVYLGVSIFFSGLMYYNFWLMAWLCAHYCVSIASSSHRLLTRLKSKCSSFSFHVPLLSTMGIMFISLLSLLLYNTEFHAQSSGNTTSESTVITAIRSYFQSPLYSAMCLLLGNSLPFIIAILSIGMTASSLLRHLCKMKQKVSGVSRPNLQALTNATRTMVLLLFFSIISSIALNLLFLPDSLKSSGLFTSANWIISTFYPAAEASIIIQASAKMRKLFLRRFCAGKFLKHQQYK